MADAGEASGVEGTDVASNDGTGCGVNRLGGKLRQPGGSATRADCGGIEVLHVVAECSVVRVLSTREIDKVVVVFADGSTETFDQAVGRDFSRTFDRPVASVTAIAGDLIDSGRPSEDCGRLNAVCGGGPVSECPPACPCPPVVQCPCPPPVTCPCPGTTPSGQATPTPTPAPSATEVASPSPPPPSEQPPPAQAPASPAGEQPPAPPPPAPSAGPSEQPPSSPPLSPTPGAPSPTQLASSPSPTLSPTPPPESPSPSIPPKSPAGGPTTLPTSPPATPGAPTSPTPTPTQAPTGAPGYLTVSADCFSLTVTSSRDIEEVVVLFADGTTERFQPFAAPEAQPERLFTLTFTKQIASVRAVSGGLVETRQPENCPPARGPAGGPEAQPPLGAPEVPGALPRVDVPGPEVPEVLNVAEAGPFGLPRTGVAARALGLTGVALLVVGIGLIRAGRTEDASGRRPAAMLPPTR